jgi:hypothetical protein
MLPFIQIHREVFSQVSHIGGWRIFKAVIGPALVENPELSVLLGTPFDDYNLLLDYDPVLLGSWIAQDVERRLPFIARAVPVHGKPLADPARTLLVRWGKRKDIRSSLAATFFSGSWSGLETAWLSDKLDEAQSWTKDPEPQVREWAKDLVEDLRRMWEQARIEEEERGW